MANKMPTFEDLHHWTVTLRFTKKAKKVTVTWKADDPESKPIRKTYKLYDPAAGPSEYAQCVADCLGNSEDLLCPILCLPKAFG